MLVTGWATSGHAGRWGGSAHRSGPTCGCCACTATPGAQPEIPRLLAAAEQLGYRTTGTPVDNPSRSAAPGGARLGKSRRPPPPSGASGCRRGTSCGRRPTGAAPPHRSRAFSIETFRKSYEVTLLDQLAPRSRAARRAGTRHRRPGHPSRPAGRGGVLAGAPRRRRAARRARQRRLGPGRGRVPAVCGHRPHLEGGLMRTPSRLLRRGAGRMSANYFGREEQLIQARPRIWANVEHTNKITPALSAALHRRQFDPVRAVRGRPDRSGCAAARAVRDAGRDGPPVSRPEPPAPRRWTACHSCVLGGSVNYSRYFNVRARTGQLPGSAWTSCW